MVHEAFNNVYMERKDEARARRAARRVGLVARKSRRAITLDNHGFFMLLDAERNFVVLGERFDLKPDEVVEYCKTL
jgi:hypothetical protein